MWLAIGVVESDEQTGQVGGSTRQRVGHPCGLESAPLETVLIHLGSRAPAYLRVCAAQARAVTGRPPVLIGARQGARYDGPKLTAFRGAENLSGMGLGGFWRYTAERFFVLEQHMRDTGLASCVHIESDNLLYAAPSGYESWLRGAFGDGVATTPITESEDTAAFMYVGSLGALERFNEALLAMVTMEGGDFLATHGGEMANEMRMLRVLRDQGLSQALPVTPEEAASAGSPHVFDAGSYGQYVDGSHAQPGISFTSDKHLVGPALAAGAYEITWNVSRDFPSVNGLPLANLHIHSKRLAPWRSPLLTPPPRAAKLPSQAGLRGGIRRAVTFSLRTASRIRSR